MNARDVDQGESGAREGDGAKDENAGALDAGAAPRPPAEEST